MPFVVNEFLVLTIRTNRFHLIKLSKDAGVSCCLAALEHVEPQF